MSHLVATQSGSQPTALQGLMDCSHSTPSCAPGGQGLWGPPSFLQPQNLEQCLANSWCSINACWMNMRQQMNGPKEIVKSFA